MYSVQRLKRMEEWFEANAHDRGACTAMRNWLIAAMNGPRLVASGDLERLPDEHGRRRRKMYFAMVPNTGALVTYHVLDTPVRVIVILSVIPSPTG